MNQEEIKALADKLIAKSNKRITQPSSPRRKPTERAWKAAERLTGIGTAKK